MVEYMDTKYGVIGADTLEALVAEVNKALSEGRGWQVSGGVTVNPHQEGARCMQVLVRRRSQEAR